VRSEDPGRRLDLLRVGSIAAPDHAQGPDTIVVRFGRPVARVRSFMRAGTPDLIWPIPSDLLSEPLPAGYRRPTHEALPERRLFLVLRADLPPTSKPAARRALAHGLNRGELLRALAPLGAAPTGWPRGAGRFEFPNLDPAEVQRWKEQGRLGRAFHVVMAYDPDGPAGLIARSLQGEWARHLIYVELMPVRGSALRRELLGGRAHLLLFEAQSPLDDPVADLASVVLPLRGPAVGSFHTGWRTRDFDAWIAPRGPVPELPIPDVERRLEDELVMLPLARLPWVWVERSEGEATRVSPRFGPRCPGIPAAAQSGH
jgi:hypothetical protein